MRSFFFLTFLVCLGFVYGRRNFTGYKVLRVPVVGIDETKTLKDLERFGVDFWTLPTIDQPTDILVPGHVFSNVSAILDKLTSSYTFVIENLQAVIDEEKEANDFAKKRYSAFFRTGKANPERIHSYYASFGEINSWLDRLSTEYRSFVSTFNIGKSHEGRNMKVLKISNGPNKPAIWIDGGIHAREWIAPSVTMYIAWKIIHGYGSKEGRITRSLVDKYDWYFLPVVNPDGYEHTQVDDRLWRKNRRQFGLRKECFGVDLNRNFDFHWAEVGTSRDSCSEIYHGPKAFSEPESENLKQALLKLRGRLQVYLSLHSYAQMWFVPYGYSKDAVPGGYDEIFRVAQEASDAVYARYRRRYKVGKPGQLLYAAAGGSYDWAIGVAGAKYSYTIELRPTQEETGNGFLLPPSAIRPTGEEIWAGIKKMVKIMKL